MKTGENTIHRFSFSMSAPEVHILFVRNDRPLAHARP